MKVFLGGVSTATNCFVNIPTTYSDFEITSLVYGSNERSAPYNPQGVLAGFLGDLKSRGWELVDGRYAHAPTGGFTTQRTYERLRDEVLADLEEALPVDIVMLVMHGGMIARGYEDSEADLVEKVRQLVGKEIPVGVLLDPHSNLSLGLMQHANLLVAYKEYPHTDMLERATELLEMLVDLKERRINPVLSTFDCRMIGLYVTEESPVRVLLKKIRTLEKEDEILSISIFNGNIYEDSPDVSVKILVTSNDNKERGDRLAQELGLELFNMRKEIPIDYIKIEEALHRASKSKDSPVILADTGDSLAAGSSGDATFLLREMVAKEVRNAVIHNIWDPMAAFIARKAGEGAELELRIGGKTGTSSGDPLDLFVRVSRLYPNLSFRVGDYRYRFGDTAVVEHQGIEIVLTSQRDGVYHPECFNAVGINPLQRQILVVKLIAEFMPGFRSVATEMLLVATPGASTWDLTKLPYKKLGRNLYPFVDDPFAE